MSKQSEETNEILCEPTAGHSLVF